MPPGDVHVVLNRPHPTLVDWKLTLVRFALFESQCPHPSLGFETRVFLSSDRSDWSVPIPP